MNTTRNTDPLSDAATPIRVSVILPVINEVTSLRQTVAILDATVAPYLGEILVVVCDRTTKASLAEVDALQSEHPGMLRRITQTLPLLGGALREGISQAAFPWVVTMFSDLESDPFVVRQFIQQAAASPDAIVSASRWRPGGKFDGYSRSKWIINFLGQKFMQRLYGGEVTDFTFGFRMYPRSCHQRCRFEEVGHPFVLESILVPILQGAKIVEVPCVWRIRREGDSQVTMAIYRHYLALAIRKWWHHKVGQGRTS